MYRVLAGREQRSGQSGNVSLSGTGGPLPQGQQGPAGQTGQRGPTGPAGQIELVVCHPVTQTVTTHGRKHKVTTQSCTTRLVSGPVRFTTTGVRSNATVTRGDVTYATGLAVPMGADRWQLALTRRIRQLRPGRYTLTLTTRHGRHRTVQRTTIAIT